MKVRGGFSLPELAVTIVLGGTTCGVLAGALASGERLARRHAERVALAGAFRVSGAVLGGELRLLDPAADLRATAQDSLALRALRGTAIACAAAGEAVLVRYTGLRDPEPDKDSVLVLEADGADRPLPLIASAATEGGCPTRTGEALLRWSIGAAPPPGTILLLYESGSYHLAADALRYRRGQGGRQPLTEEVFDLRASMFRALAVPDAGSGSPAAAAAVEVSLAARPADPRRGSGRPGPFAARFRIAFLNSTPAVAGHRDAGGAP